MLSSPVAVLLIALPAADLPPGKFNLPVQKRTRTCVKMKGEFVPLRFPDGTPTGFWAHANDPSQQGSADPCGVGFMEIDAHEVLRTADQMRTYFHPGGGPSQYRDYIETGQYGHIARNDLAGRIKLIPTRNGKPAPVRSGRNYFVTPTRIPRDMWYKPNVSNGKSGARYFTYGNPGYDKTYGRGDWTYLSWSWVQNGGKRHPENLGRGGGIARALLKRGMRLTACDVDPILGVSYGADNLINGRVTAFYARTYAGPGEGGSVLHGWLPHSYQKNNDIIVPCVRRTPEPPERGSPSDALSSQIADTMDRMAANLFYELEVDDAEAERARADWTKNYDAEQNAFARMAILTEMVRADREDTVELMLQFLAREEVSRVREQAIVLIGYMRSTDKLIEPVCAAMQSAFLKTDSEWERVRILDVMSNLPAPETVKLMGKIVPTLGSAEENVELHVAAAGAVLKLSVGTSVDESLVNKTLGNLKHHAETSRSRGVRARMIRQLAAPSRDQLPYLLGLLKTERNPRVREIIKTVTANLQIGR